MISIITGFTYYQNLLRSNNTELKELDVETNDIRPLNTGHGLPKGTKKI